MNPYPSPPSAAAAHYRPDAWDAANRILLAKALCEFAHERLIEPAPDPDAPGWFTVTSDDGTPAYRFAARRMPLRHWQIDPGSITCDGGRLDAVGFVLGLREALGLGPDMLPAYLEEISSTLSSLSFKLSLPQPSAADLVTADFQTVEAAMLAGHPCFVANSGRIGFGAHESQAFAPEAARDVRLIWLAAHRSHADFSSCRDTTYADFLRAELGPQREQFDADLRDRGLDPDDYLLIPVHPWQWWNRLSITFAADIAQDRLVPLGESRDVYQAQQSVRTFFNRTRQDRHYVKTAVSVVNMGFVRGLSAAYMAATPAINDWLADLFASDATLRATGALLIRERAAIGYHPEAYEAATPAGSPYRKMLAALWRESPVPLLEPDRRLATMAALLHRDPDGQSYAAALIAHAGVAPTTWLRSYLDAYLQPLLHALYRYGLAFMPHGENVILVLHQGNVERVILKDLAEEIVVMRPDTHLPTEAERVRAQVPSDLQALSIFTDVFDCFFRHLAALLNADGVLPWDDFWRTVADVVADYQAAHPELADRYDLFAAQFPLSCLNRLQLRDNRQMVDLADPAGALQLLGTLDNPLAAHAPVSAVSPVSAGR
ncbi:IucA/IucC family siderophore biosynthesis protein [Calidifontibacter sp. DB0510]|uniref:IucA/IucC family siderophore biosynthesis protein n=1 Tax=Metallococcus carri TaxID=1656884 RepID=A0A967AZM1_9MICO|nr:IucA/IucC family siderophore biosynthesis protein [Metallococcus carri]NHN55613.1 IucA/IucC family siderophore biosynthesis protein [Metallococcus carri]NOP38203.1 IucA/IucC family siderophore biosynthesis protein [Calidifontibacter sp. DB2511S]